MKAGFEVASYEDEAVGTMTKNENGVYWINLVALHPKIVYAGQKQPSADEQIRLHHGAHDQCFISNSIKTQVTFQ
jgi:organic hydroperoxide reductase OsmC/OhrA